LIGKRLWQADAGHEDSKRTNIESPNSAIVFCGE